jgi:excisionase family DNA binding protein
MKKANTSIAKPVDVKAPKLHVKVRAPERATVSIKESTKYTGFGLTHSYRLVRSAELPTIRVGKQFFVPVAALMRWLENCGAETRPAA